MKQPATSAISEALEGESENNGKASRYEVRHLITGTTDMQLLMKQAFLYIGDFSSS
jgi:hypothetical protein